MLSYVLSTTFVGGNPMLVTIENLTRPDEIPQITAELIRDLRDISELQVEVPAAGPGAGARDGGEVLGQILLAFVTGGAAKGVFDVLKVYLARDRSLKFRIRRPDGVEVEVTSASVSKHDVESLFASVDKTLQDQELQ
jgi:hypothetical protein